MRLKEECRLTVMGDEYVYIPISDEYKDYTTLIAFNGMGAKLITAFAKDDFDEDDLVRFLTSRYAVEEPVAREDVKQFLVEMREANLLAK